MADLRWKQSLTNLGKALDRLEEVLAVQLTEDNDYVIDATIQRFEFTIELYWKTLKHLLAFEGIETKFPKQALQEAYKANWIQDEKLWLRMISDRNLTSHTYREELALQIYRDIQEYYPAFRATYQLLTQKYTLSKMEKNYDTKS